MIKKKKPAKKKTVSKFYILDFGDMTFYGPYKTEAAAKKAAMKEVDCCNTVMIGAALCSSNPTTSRVWK